MMVNLHVFFFTFFLKFLKIFLSIHFFLNTFDTGFPNNWSIFGNLIQIVFNLAIYLVL